MERVPGLGWRDDDEASCCLDRHICAAKWHIQIRRFGFWLRLSPQLKSRKPLQPLPFRETKQRHSAPSHVGLRQQTIRTVYHFQVTGEDERQRLWPSSRRRVSSLLGPPVLIVLVLSTDIAFTKEATVGSPGNRTNDSSSNVQNMVLEEHADGCCVVDTFPAILRRSDSSCRGDAGRFSFHNSNGSNWN